MCAMINSTMADILFGSKSTVSSGSFLSASSLGDWGMIKSGTYKKLMRSYYEKVESSSESTKSTKSTKSTDTDDTTETGGTSGVISSLYSSTADTSLSAVKSASKSLVSAADNLLDTEFDDVSREDLYENVKKLTDSYNAVIDKTSDTDLVSISQSTSWMVSDTKSNEDSLNDIGITIGSDNKLSINKDTFKEASLNDIASLFEGSSSYAARLSQRANGLVNLAANQLSYQSGQTLYSSSGVLV